jgi:hypothetical protein
LSGDPPVARRFASKAGACFAWGAGAFLILILPASTARAQISSNIAGVTLGATLNSSLSVIAAPNAVNFALVQNGVANGSTAVTVTTIWALHPSIGAVTLYAYFTSAAAALSNGAGTNIASSRVAGSANGGAFSAFTGSSPFAAGSSITLATWRILGNNRNGNRQDTLGLQIDTTGLALPAGSYNGVLNIQAQAL